MAGVEKIKDSIGSNANIILYGMLAIAIIAAVAMAVGSISEMQLLEVLTAVGVFYGGITKIYIDYSAKINCTTCDALQFAKEHGYKSDA